MARSSVAVAALLEPSAEHLAARRFLVVLPITFVAVQIVGSGTDLFLATALDHIHPGAAVTTFGLITGIASLFALVAHPLAGVFSDRTPVRLGRRSAWVAIGAIGSTVGLLALGQAHEVPLAAIGYVVAFACLPVIFVPLYASIADRVAPSSRGVAGAIIAGSTIIGGVAGNVIAARFAADITAGLSLFAALLLGGAATFFLLAGESRTERPPDRMAPGHPEVDRHRRPASDLAWFSLGRFLVFFAYVAVTGLAYYIIRDDIGRPNPAGGVAIFSIVSGGATLVASVISGPWSDRLRRRKPFVAAAGVAIGLGALLPAVSPTFLAFLAAGAIVGLGFGIYFAVGTALGTLVLPSAETSGRDLGLIGFSNAAAQATAPFLGAYVVATLGYPILFAAAAGASLASVLAILPIRTVR